LSVLRTVHVLSVQAAFASAAAACTAAGSMLGIWLSARVLQQQQQQRHNLLCMLAEF
jgi:uncharacterized membrane protein YfcA